MAATADVAHHIVNVLPFKIALIGVLGNWCTMASVETAKTCNCTHGYSWAFIWAIIRLAT